MASDQESLKDRHHMISSGFNMLQLMLEDTAKVEENNALKSIAAKVDALHHDFADTIGL